MCQARADLSKAWKVGAPSPGGSLSGTGAPSGSALPLAGAGSGGEAQGAGIALHRKLGWSIVCGSGEVYIVGQPGNQNGKAGRDARISWEKAGQGETAQPHLLLLEMAEGGTFDE